MRETHSTDRVWAILEGGVAEGMDFKVIRKQTYLKSL